MAEDVDRVVIALLAGAIAHKRKVSDIGDAASGDEWRIAEVLKAHASNELARQTKRKELESRAEALVSEHWGTIVTLAQRLSNKPWKPTRKYHALPKGKALTGYEIREAVLPTTVVVDENVE